MIRLAFFYLYLLTVIAVTVFAGYGFLSFVAGTSNIHVWHWGGRLVLALWATAAVAFWLAAAQRIHR